MTARVRKIVKGGKNGYTPRSVRRKEIPKPNGSTRPLGIPCIWDRLVQQCIKQVMEPICEARFSNNSYGFRPNRSVENAIAATYRLMQKSGLHYVVEFDIKGFFDNVDHSKLIKQLWSLNIRDKELLYVIRRILKAPILMPDGHTEHPTKGTPQGGIISPLLANVVLNELDHWIESQWQCNPVTENYAYRENAAGCPIQSHAYRAMRNTRLKEMYIVRYADDFRILCRTREQADRTLIAVTHWLKERLRLDVSPEKTRVVDTRRSYSEFLGFKIRLHKKGKKYVVQSHMCDKAYKKVKASLTKQVGNIKFPRKDRGEAGEVRLFNSMVMGIQNYYQLATDISIDCGDIGRTVNIVLKNRLKSGKTHRLKEEGRDLTKMELQRYGKSEQLRYIAQSKEPIYPISYVQCTNPMNLRRKVCAYTATGRSAIHDDLRINTFLLLQLMRAPTYSHSAEYADNRISLFSAQWGKCAITGKKLGICWGNHSGRSIQLGLEILDAQFWGVAQRRKSYRIFLVADFCRTKCHPSLFEQDRLLRDSAPGRSQRQKNFRPSSGRRCSSRRDSPHWIRRIQRRPDRKKAATLGVNCGMSTGRNSVITAFAANQRDEVQDLHDDRRGAGRPAWDETADLCGRNHGQSGQRRLLSL